MYQNPQLSEARLRLRKALLIAPVIAVPLLALAFYALGGGKGSTTTHMTQAGSHGLNLTLPIPHFHTDKPMDKMAAYHQADLDSAKWRERIKMDPYYNQASAALVHAPTGTNSPLSLTPPTKTDSMAEQVRASLARLQKLVISREVATTDEKPHVIPSEARRADEEPQLPNTTPPDPQMDRLNTLLDKLIKVQHPDEADGSAPNDATASHDVTAPHDALPVTATPSPQPITSLSVANTSADPTDFIPIDVIPSERSDEGPQSLSNTIPAVINQNQTLVAGATIELRLTEDADINGTHIPKDNLIYGQADLKGERLIININSILHQGSIYPVSLSVYDLDGLPGIYIPGAISRDVSKQSADQAINALGVTAFDPSLAGQAASASIQAAKTLLSRKVKLVRVSVKAGYQVLLKNTKIKNR